MRALRLLILVAAGALSSAPSSAQGDEERAIKSFSLPETQSARSLFERARGHVDAQRWSDGISGLQELLEVHRGAVLGPERRDDLGRKSQQDVHAGVAKRVTELLTRLETKARGAYRDRFEQMAGAELLRARRTGDARAAQALVELARRWPITVAAEHAWLALGDLELERGNVDAALLAWRRGEGLARDLGDPLVLGTSREGLLDPREARKNELPEPVSGGLRLDDGTRTLGPLPGPDCHAWRRKLIDDDPNIGGALRSTQGSPVMHPVLVGDRVLVQTPLRLLAYNAYSGHREWRSDEAPGWQKVDAREVRVYDRAERREHVLQRSEFFQGVNGPALMLAPTAWGNVAVAALQVPISVLPNWKYQNIQVTTITPERRLFAFDLGSGEPLWSHLPPPLWDGESGSFTDRMRVAGPPIAWQGRVFAPFYRMQGRIEFHVGCFDLYTGALLWSTALISGQVELNMFGRQHRELAAPPVLVHGDKVIAMTQLGVLAALDVFTGDIVWETLYDQLPLPAAEGFSPGERDEYWLASPPVVADGVVVATPLDCEDLIGVDVERGTLLWSKSQTRIARMTTKLALLGADDHSVVLGSASQVIQLASNAGLATQQAPSDFSWSDRVLGEAFLGPDTQPRPLLVGDRVVVPSAAKRWVLPRANLRTADAQLSAPWPSDPSSGNLAVGPGVLYSLSSNQGGSTLVGLCDWNSLEERLQRDFQRDPTDVDLACAWADFLVSRANLEHREGRTAKALGYFGRLRAALEPAVERSARADRQTGTRGAPPRGVGRRSAFAGRPRGRARRGRTARTFAHLRDRGRAATRHALGARRSRARPRSDPLPQFAGRTRRRRGASRSAARHRRSRAERRRSRERRPAGRRRRRRARIDRPVGATRARATRAHRRRPRARARGAP
jgi:outer membrane protein assembly factor BamB